MYRNVDFTSQESVLDFFSKETFTFHLVKTEVLDAIPPGFDDLYFCR
jgi:hypothetical protein